MILLLLPVEVVVLWTDADLLGHLHDGVNLYKVGLLSK